MAKMAWLCTHFLGMPWHTHLLLIRILPLWAPPLRWAWLLSIRKTGSLFHETEGRNASWPVYAKHETNHTGADRKEGRKKMGWRPQTETWADRHDRHGWEACGAACGYHWLISSAFQTNRHYIIRAGDKTDMCAACKRIPYLPSPSIMALYNKSTWASTFHA